MIFRSDRKIRPNSAVSRKKVMSEQCWIRFVTAARCGKLEYHFLNKLLADECTCFISENS